MIGPEALQSLSHLGALAVAAIPFAAILLKMPPGSIITNLATRQKGQGYPQAVPFSSATQATDKVSGMTTVLVPSGGEAIVKFLKANNAHGTIEEIKVYDYRRRAPLKENPGNALLVGRIFTKSLTVPGEQVETPIGVTAVYQYNDQEKQVN